MRSFFKLIPQVLDKICKDKKASLAAFPQQNKFLTGALIKKKLKHEFKKWLSVKCKEKPEQNNKSTTN